MRSLLALICFNGFVPALHQLPSVLLSNFMWSERRSRTSRDLILQANHLHKGFRWWLQNMYVLRTSSFWDHVPAWYLSKRTPAVSVAITWSEPAMTSTYPVYIYIIIEHNLIIISYSWFIGKWLWVGVWKRGKQAEVQPGSFARHGCHHVIVSRTKGLRGTPTLSLRRNEQFKEPLGVTELQESQEFQSGWIMIVLSCICCHKLQDWKIFKTYHVDIIFETRGICQVQPLCLQNVHLRYAADHMPASFRLFQEMNYQLSASRLHMSHMVPPASTFRIQSVSSVFRSCQYHHSP